MKNIEMKKFGSVLNGRPSAKEAVARVRQMVNGSGEDIQLDFSLVDVLTPSFADEFANGLAEHYPTKKVTYFGLEKNQSITETLKAVNIQV
ncbi:MAG: DUF4325 domain-containing protein [Candidatus Moranbacteria bacterium]|nr:DUF4325 domain-containing protein [Candidatus Moranbacteria bacterium]